MSANVIAIESLQRDGDALEQECSLAVVVADSCEVAAQLLKKHIIISFCFSFFVCFFAPACIKPARLQILY